MSVCYSVWECDSYRGTVIVHATTSGSGLVLSPVLLPACVVFCEWSVVCRLVVSVSGTGCECLLAVRSVLSGVTVVIDLIDVYRAGSMLY